MRWSRRKASDIEGHPQHEQLDEGYYLMHADYPGGRRALDPSVAEVYAVLNAASAHIYREVIQSLGAATAEFESYRHEYAELLERLKEARSDSREIT